MLNPHKVGLTLGSFVGLLHLVWSILIACGVAESLVQFSMNMHMVNATVSIAPFSLTNALGLIIIALVVGYIVGQVFARVWNMMHKM